MWGVKMFIFSAGGIRKGRKTNTQRHKTWPNSINKQ